jgi:hypothetical protein
MQFLFVGFIVLFVVAITGSKRPVGTILNILLSIAIGIGVGAGLGYATGNMAAGGTTAGLLGVALGLATSIREVIANRKQRKNPLIPPS